MEKFLKTQRLFLRNLRAEDAETIHAYRNDPRCYTFQRWEDTSLSSIRSFVGDFEKDVFLSPKGEQHYAICIGSALAGDLSWFYTEADNCITLGITIAPEYQRRGIAREILEAVICAIQTKYPMRDIVALIDRGNAASIALFEKLGFYRECYAESIASYVYVIDGKSK